MGKVECGAGCSVRTTCRLCGTSNLERVLELAPTPLANAFLSEPAPQERYPLDLMLCGGCGHVQLGVVVDPALLYPDYLYSTATFKDPPEWHPVVRSFQAYAEQIVERFGRGFVVDVGCNDATLLRAFRGLGCNVLGVDPASLSRESASEDVPIRQAFFSLEEAERIRGDYARADIVTANNVFAHVDELRDAVLGVKHLLAPSGVFVMQCSYLGDIVEKGLFDTIYHEHLDYHAVEPLVAFFARLGMQVFDVEHVSLYGGSMRLYVTKQLGAPGVRVQEAVDYERVFGLSDPRTYRQLSDRVDWARDRFLSRMQPGSIGFGAPAKLTTLMYHWGLTSGDIRYVVDDTPAKQDRYTPGMHIPIRPTSELGDAEDVVVFAWNCADAIMERHGERKYVVPRFGL